MVVKGDLQTLIESFLRLQRVVLNGQESECLEFKCFIIKVSVHQSSGLGSLFSVYILTIYRII